MRLRSFQITDEMHIVEVPVDEGSFDWLEHPVHRWIDIEAPEEDELNEFLAPLKINAEMLAARLEPTSGFFGEILEKLTFIRLPTQISSAVGSGLTNISLLCLPTTLVTIHQQPLSAISDLAFRLTSRTRLKSATTSALVYQIIARLAAENFFAFTACRQKQDALASRLVEDSGSVMPEDLFALRQQVANISATNEDHAFCVDLLQKVEGDSFSAGDQLQHLLELDQSLGRQQRSMDRLEENVKDLQQQFLLAVQDRTGNRLKYLTILSAVFLPLTLIAGIYGMNFEYMPELSMRYSYHLILAIMAVVAISMLAYFYKQGWFD